ncbi:MAG TPA: hypothetical protein VLF18_17590 [Tahibacter sp.]|uniref:hypothetical protein n=1 Tax=Tahibacter sp. TaxID=2056211 RepID=UPI002B59E9F3|nr:hypothetical protein [Tahibacter sp.]HSX62004.1 hypothetical protein [Tahibacter sp.]
MRFLPVLFGILALPALAADAPPQSFAYSMYTQMAADYAARLSERDLLDRIIAPGPQGLLIRFAPGTDARATVHLSSGVLRYAADERDILRLPDKREWRRDNPRIDLSARPLAVALDFGD